MVGTSGRKANVCPGTVSGHQQNKAVCVSPCPDSEEILYLPLQFAAFTLFTYQAPSSILMTHPQWRKIFYQRSDLNMNIMDNKIAKQAMDFQKATFDNTFNGITMIQDQAERAFTTLLETGMWPLPEEGKKVLKEWTQSFKKGRDEFKKVMDEAFNKVEGFFAHEKPKAE
jgi:hypothetical protein